MFARLALHRFASPEAATAAEQNLRERLLPVLRRQPDVTAFWGHTPDRADGLSFTLGGELARLQAGGRAINAAPALPGQDLSRIRDPETVHFCEVVAAATGAATARVGRLVWLGASAGDADRAAFAPSVGGLPGLARAYLLRETETGRRFSLALWESDDALGADDEAIAGWGRAQSTTGGGAALRPERAVTYTIFLHLATGADAPDQAAR